MSQNIARYSFVVDSAGSEVQLAGVADLSYYYRGMRAPIQQGVALTSDFTYPLTGHYVSVSGETTGEFWGQFLDSAYMPLSDIMLITRGQSHKISPSFIRVVGVRRAGHVVFNCYAEPTAPGVEGSISPMINHYTVQDNFSLYESDEGDNTFGRLWRTTTPCRFALSDATVVSQGPMLETINPLYYDSMFFCFVETTDDLTSTVMPVYDMIRRKPCESITINPWYTTGVAFIQNAAGIAAEGSNVLPTGYFGSRFLARGAGLYAR